MKSVDTSETDQVLGYSTEAERGVTHREATKGETGSVMLAFPSAGYVFLSHHNKKLCLLTAATVLTSVSVLHVKSHVVPLNLVLNTKSLRFQPLQKNWFSR